MATATQRSGAEAQEGERCRRRGRSGLSVHRAFVVHLNAAGGPTRRRFSGRVEHLSSGRTAQFSSLTGLLAFFGEFLADPRPRERPPNPDGACSLPPRTRPLNQAAEAEPLVVIDPGGRDRGVERRHHPKPGLVPGEIGETHDDPESMPMASDRSDHPRARERRPRGVHEESEALASGHGDDPRDRAGRADRAEGRSNPGSVLLLAHGEGQRQRRGGCVRLRRADLRSARRRSPPEGPSIRDEPRHRLCDSRSQRQSVRGNSRLQRVRRRRRTGVHGVRSPRPAGPRAGQGEFGFQDGRHTRQTPQGSRERGRAAGRLRCLGCAGGRSRGSRQLAVHDYPCRRWEHLLLGGAASVVRGLRPVRCERFGPMHGGRVPVAEDRPSKPNGDRWRGRRRSARRH